MHATKKGDGSPRCCAHDLMPTQGLRVPSPFLASKSPVPFSDRPLIRQICSLAGSDLSDEELLKRFAKDGDSFAADVLVRRVSQGGRDAPRQHGDAGVAVVELLARVIQSRRAFP